MQILKSFLCKILQGLRRVISKREKNDNTEENAQAKKFRDNNASHQSFMKSSSLSERIHPASTPCVADRMDAAKHHLRIK